MLFIENEIGTAISSRTKLVGKKLTLITINISNLLLKFCFCCTYREKNKQNELQIGILKQMLLYQKNNEIDIDLECHFEVFSFCCISVLMLFTCIFVTSIDQSIFKLKILMCLEHDQLNGNFITRFRRMHIIDRSQKK